MPELRWILLIVGAVLVAGLWWWELRRAGRRGADAEGAPPAVAERAEPVIDGAGAATPTDLPVIRAGPDERPIPRGDPPVLTIDDLPEDTDRVVLAPASPARRPEASGRRAEPGFTAVDVKGRQEPTLDLDVLVEGEAGAADERAFRPEPSPAAAHATTARGAAAEPTLGSLEPAARATVATGAAAGAARSAPAESGAEPAAGARVAGPAPPRAPQAPRPEPLPRGPAPRPAAERGSRATAPAADRTHAEPPAAQQRIVALRLVAADDIEGLELRTALEAEGLRFGKYSIFHRQRVDGRSIFSAASLLEPGSFDLDRMNSQAFPGISLFAVFPGPLAAPEGFDEMVATARRLADRLDAGLQDERGQPLAATRLLAIREELEHFQQLAERARARPTA